MFWVSGRMTSNTALSEPLHFLGKVKLKQYRNYIPCLKVMMKNKHEADVVPKTSLRLSLEWCYRML